MNKNYKDPVCEHILKYIKDNDVLYKTYYNNHKQKKYKLDDVLPIIFFVLKTNLPWRAIKNLKLDIDISYQENVVYTKYIES